MNKKTSRLISLLVTVSIFTIGITITIDIYEDFKQSDSSTNTAEPEWFTYSNADYGYEISYPSTVEFKTLSEIGGRDEAAAKNQIVFVGDSGGELMFNMTVGAPVSGFTANSLEELRLNYLSYAIPTLVNGRTGSRYNMTEVDFSITETEHNNKPALEVVSPSSHTLTTFNDLGEVFSVISSEYRGGTSTPKEQLTRDIIDTFRVLEE